MHYVIKNKRFTKGTLCVIIRFAKEYWTEGLIPCRRVLLQKLTVSQATKNLTSFMEYEALLSPSQKPAFCPYPEPDKSVVLPSCFFKTIYYIHVCVLFFQLVYFRQVYHRHPECTIFSHMYSTCSAPLVRLYL